MNAWPRSSFGRALELGVADHDARLADAARRAARAAQRPERAQTRPGRVEERLPRRRDHGREAARPPARARSGPRPSSRPGRSRCARPSRCSGGRRRRRSRRRGRRGRRWRRRTRSRWRSSARRTRAARPGPGRRPGRCSGSRACCRRPSSRRPTATPSSLMSSMNTWRPPSDGISTICARSRRRATKPERAAAAQLARHHLRRRGARRGRPRAAVVARRRRSPCTPAAQRQRQREGERPHARARIPYTQTISRAAPMYARTHILKRAAAASFVARGTSSARAATYFFLAGGALAARPAARRRLRDQAAVRRALQHDDGLQRLHLVRLAREHLHQVAARPQRDVGLELHLGAVARQLVGLIERLLHRDLRVAVPDAHVDVAHQPVVRRLALDVHAVARSRPSAQSPSARGGVTCHSGFSVAVDGAAAGLEVRGRDERRAGRVDLDARERPQLAAGLEHAALGRAADHQRRVARRLAQRRVLARDGRRARQRLRRRPGRRRP